MRRILTALIALCLAIPALSFAQEITFTAETTTGNGQVVPVLSWSTSPVADSCVASGGWSGEKGPSGTETLPAITSSETYNLTCTWAADDDITVSWTNPTQNTDGSPYTDPKGILIEYSPDGEDPWFLHPVPDPTATSTVIEDLEPGDWFFRGYAMNQADVQSDPSSVATAVAEPESQDQETIGITVNPKPQTLTDFRAE